MNNDIDDILNTIDFYKIKVVMDLLDWKYYNSQGDTVNINELRKMVSSLLKEAYLYKDSNNYFNSCGGFHVERTMYPGDSKKYFTVKFVVEEVTNEH